MHVLVCHANKLAVDSAKENTHSMLGQIVDLTDKTLHKEKSPINIVHPNCLSILDSVPFESITLVAFKIS